MLEFELGCYTGALRRGVPLLLLITFHICSWREPTLKTIKGAPSTSHTHTISYVKEKSREAPPLCIISLGNV